MTNNIRHLVLTKSLYPLQYACISGSSYKFHQAGLSSDGHDKSEVGLEGKDSALAFSLKSEISYPIYLLILIKTHCPDTESSFFIFFIYAVESYFFLPTVSSFTCPFHQFLLSHHPFPLHKLELP